MTPVKMAATRNNYHILKLLLDHGFPVPSPDDHQWTSVQTSRAWLTAYRAVCSPSLILLTSPDPFRTCFRTARALRNACWKREHYRAELEELADQCETFACELLAEVRDSDELETVLEFNPGETTDKQVLRGTLEAAVEMEQKKFVSHALSFEYADLLAAGDIYELLDSKTLQQWAIWQLVLFAVAIGIFHPFLTILHILAPTTKPGRLLEIPAIRGMCWFVSLLSLLIVLIVEAQTFRVSSEEIDRMVQNIPTSAVQLSWTQAFIFLWMCGFFVEQINKVWHQGISPYFQSFWNLLDFFAVALYITHVALRLVAIAKWDLHDGHDISLDWAARARWNGFEPLLVSDAVFAIFTLDVFLRAMCFLRMSRNLGSLQISFGRMFMDIIKFVIFLGLVDLAFACGFNQLYWFYGSVHNYLCEKYQQSNLQNIGCSKAHGYATLSRTMLTLFWAEFGISDLSMLELKPGSSPVEALQLMEEPIFTEVVGTIMFALFQVVAVLVLLNLLIAIMTTSYQMTEDNKDQEWAYMSVRDAFDVIRGNLSLPPPFNLLMRLKSGLVHLFCSSPCSRTEIGPPRLSGHHKYQTVIDKLAKRYRLRKEREKAD
ncbi:short transient receptor potential channel 4-like [Branchiostoma floridae]|uniref:Short transient receptor potential channel 4-like n=1 Tax=Branchiostoma floridae TaxID=7739 RepID=A0A9J7MLQ3_BRAFL|nr:short transient receptor potential channel 4-like [Branchiostoma floridae]